MPGVGTFSLDVQRWAGATTEILDKVSRESAMDVGIEIVRRTPVDVYHEDDVSARGDWTAKAGGIPEAVDRGDESGELAKEDIIAAATAWNPSKGETLFIAHHGEYIEKLEYGTYPEPRRPVRLVPAWFSFQAPQGMVGVTIERWADIVEKNRAKYARA